MRHKLTDAKIRAAKPTAKAYKLADGGGLFLHVQPNGSKLWRFRFWLGGKEQLFAVGGFPDLGLAEARKATDEARELAEQGINPAHARQDNRRANLEAIELRKRQKEGTFAKVAEEWFKAESPGWADVTRDAKRSRLDGILLPALGSVPIATIGHAQVRALLEKQAQWTAVFVKTQLQQIFQYALVRGLCEFNPVPGLRGLIRVPPSENKAALTRAQITTFFAKARAHRGYPETLPLFRLIAMTACRPGEACEAEWSEFDFDEALWRIPKEKMKNRRPHLSPLPRQAVEMLKELKQITGSGRYVFPSRDGKTHAITTRLSVVMKKMDLGPRTSPHCWRTTFSTWANENGYSVDAIERQLAHVERNKVRAAYNKALLVPERRELLQAWADYLEKAEAAGGGRPC